MTPRDRTWRPTKFELDGTRLRGSRDPEWVYPGSRILVDLLAPVYQQAVATFARGACADVGCGAAPLYCVYRDRASDVFWVDWQRSPGGVELDLAHDLNEPFPLADATFDTIIATDVIEHLREPEVFFREAARLLRPGGHLIIGAPFLYWIHEEPHDYHRYTRYRLEQLCRVCGLTVAQIAPYGGAAEVLLDITGKLLTGRPLLLRLHNAVARLYLRTAMARAILRRTADKFPLGYVLVARR